MVYPHAGGVGLCEYIQYLAMIDYVAIADTREGEAVKYVDHPHQNFVDPCAIEGAANMPRRRPGFVFATKPATPHVSRPKRVAEQA